MSGFIIGQLLVTSALVGLTLALLGLVVSMFAFNLSVFLGVPFVPTPARFALTIGELLAIVPGDVVYDLGSGDGRVLHTLAKQYPEAHFVGIEGNPFLVLFARRRASRARVTNVTYRRKNIFRADYQDATKMYLYLLNSVLTKLSPTIDASPRLTHIVSRAFVFPHKEPVSVTDIGGLCTHDENNLRLYVFDR
jgi:SAM-dependent methyltransferase